MRAPGLKTQISLTVFLLLFTGSILLGLIITLFWQQSLIRGEGAKLRMTLELTTQRLAAAAENSGEKPSDILDSIQMTTGVECLVLSNVIAQDLITSGPCRTLRHVKRTLQESSTISQPITETYGTTWGVFAPGPEFLILARPHGEQSPSGYIGAAASLKPVYVRIRQKQKIILVYLAANILIIGTIGFFRLVKSTVRPVERLVRITESYVDENNFLFFPGPEGNEFGQLSSSLNRMIQRIDSDRKRLRETVASLEEANRKFKQAQKEMIRAEKLASIGRLSAGLAHEIGNPIGIVKGYLDLLQRQSLDDTKRLQYIHRASGELERIDRLIRQLLDFARSSSADKRQIHINSLLKDIFELFQTRKKMDHITFTLKPEASYDLLETSEARLRQVLLNFLLNAVDAIEEQGTDYEGKIFIASEEDKITNSLVITVSDNGCGIDPAYLANIFDPFFTTKEPGKGTGLGLSVSHTIIESLGGRITVDSSPGRGTEIKIILPRTR